MQRLLITAATLAVLVYALVLGVKLLAPRIEADLNGRLTTELAKGGQLWATTQVQGREVTLVGEAPSTEAQTAARMAVAKVFGVAKLADLTTLPGQVVSNGLVISATTVAALSKAEQRAKAQAEGGYSLTIEKQGEALKISGNVPDADAKALLLTLAQTHFPGAQLDTAGLEIVAAGAPAGWRSAAGTVLFNLTNLETATATLMGREVMVSGTVLAADFAETAESRIREALPTLYQVAFAVDTAAPVTAVAPITITPIAPIAPIAEVLPTEVVTASAVVAAKAIDVLATPAPKAEVKVAVAEADFAAVQPSAGPATNAATCAGMATVAQERLMFGFDSAKVRKADAAVVSRVASVVKGCATAKLEVQGFTDKTGSKTYNLWLSEQRAEAGMRALLRQGAASSALSAKGYGETTRFGKTQRAANRRVVFSAK